MHKKKQDSMQSSYVQSYKTKVQQAFSRHAQSYDHHAGLQAHAATQSAELLQNLKSKAAIPDGEILEIGCGTGLFSSKLVQLFPKRKIICSDLSPEMLKLCSMRLAAQENEQLEFQTIDAEELPEDPQYAIIASSFAIQWFYQPIEGLAKLFKALKPGGIVLFSVPGNQSCPEWKKAAAALNIPFTRNPLPSLKELQDLAIRSCMEFRLSDHQIEETHPDAISMLRSLKELGAGTQRNNLHMNCIELRRLLRELDRAAKPLQSSYQIISGYFRKVQE